MVQLAEGDIVLSNSPDLMIGDKTISDFVSGLVNHNIKKRSKGTQDAVEANIKKALVMQEGMKTRRDIKKKHDVRGILKAADGDPDVDEPITEKEERELLRKLNISVNPNYNKNISHSRELAKSSWYSSGDKKKYNQAGEAIAEWLKNNPTELAKAKAELSNLPQMKKYLNKGVDFIDAVVKNVSDGLYGQVHDYFNVSDTNLKQYGLPESEWDFVEPELDVPITKIKVNEKRPAFEDKLFEAVKHDLE